MSEIDFAEIEKAMAELVNKAQGKERQQGLGQVAKERSQIAKEIETSQEQGEIATKRIIVASNKIRSNPQPHPRPQPKQYPSPSYSGRVMDFISPEKNNQNTKLSEDNHELAHQDNPPELQKTVGDLSNDYLISQVNKPDTDLAEESEADIKDEIDNEIYSDNSIQTSSVANAPDEPEELMGSTSLEDLTGPAPVMSTVQGPRAEDTDIERPEHEDTLPEADQLASDIGKVHKIYGQRLPKEYLKKNKKSSAEKTSSVSLNKSGEYRHKRGFAFYFTLTMIVASVVVWGAAAYLYFAA